MKKYTLIILIFFVLVSCSSKEQTLNPHSFPYQISIYRLLAQPEELSGVKVQVIGLLTRSGSDGISLFPNQTRADIYDDTSRFAVQVSDDCNSSIPIGFEGYAMVEGVVCMNGNTLCDVERIFQRIPNPEGSVTRKKICNPGLSPIK